MLSETLLKNENGPIRLLQITDTHLFAPIEGALLGVPTLYSFQSVIEQVQQRTSGFSAILATENSEELAHGIKPRNKKKK